MTDRDERTAERLVRSGQVSAETVAGWLGVDLRALVQRVVELEQHVVLQQHVVLLQQSFSAQAQRLDGFDPDRQAAAVVERELERRGMRVPHGEHCLDFNSTTDATCRLHAGHLGDHRGEGHQGAVFLWSRAGVRLLACDASAAGWSQGCQLPLGHVGNHRFMFGSREVSWGDDECDFSQGCYDYLGSRDATCYLPLGHGGPHRGYGLGAVHQWAREQLPEQGATGQ